MGQATFPALEHVIYAFDGTLTVPDGCLMYHDTNDAKPAASQADGGTEALNQKTFAANFAGVADERKVSSDTTAGTIAVLPTWVGDIPCSSSTFEVGDLVGPVEAASGTALENFKVAKVTNPDLAIGFVVKRAASAVTTVRVCLLSRVSGHGRLPGQPRLSKLVSQTMLYSAFTDGGGAAGTLLFTGTLPAGSLVLGWEANVATGFTGDTTAVISVGITGTAAKFSADTAQSVLAAGRVGAHSLAASSFQATAISPMVTVTGGADWGSVAAGSMVVTLFYIATY